MTEQQAVNRAQRLAKYGRAAMFVYYERDGVYEVGNEFDSRNFFLGQKPVHSFNELGEEIDCNAIAM